MKIALEALGGLADLRVPAAASAAAVAAAAARGGDRRDVIGADRSPCPSSRRSRETTLLEASNARCVTMREIISVPTSTLDDSRTPWESPPRLPVPGRRASAAPELAVAVNRLSPAAERPEGFAKAAVVIVAELLDRAVDRGADRRRWGRWSRRSRRRGSVIARLEQLAARQAEAAVGVHLEVAGAGVGERAVRARHLDEALALDRDVEVAAGVLEGALLVLLGDLRRARRPGRPGRSLPVGRRKGW